MFKKLWDNIEILNPMLINLLYIGFGMYFILNDEYSLFFWFSVFVIALTTSNNNVLLAMMYKKLMKDK